MERRVFWNFTAAFANAISGSNGERSFPYHSYGGYLYNGQILLAAGFFFRKNGLIHTPSLYIIKYKSILLLPLAGLGLDF